MNSLQGDFKSRGGVGNEMKFCRSFLKLFLKDETLPEMMQFER